MKLRVSNYGLPATHPSILNLADFNDPVSISDYDAFIFDPATFRGQTVSGASFYRRRQEIGDVVNRKGGIVVCVLQPNEIVVIGSGTNTAWYEILGLVKPDVRQLLNSYLRAGEGSQITASPNAQGAAREYFRILKGKLRFAAYLDGPMSEITKANGTVFAISSVGLPVAIEFREGPGRICFVPLPYDVTGERLGSAIARIIDTHFGEPSELDAPSWVSQVIVPGADIHDGKITELKTRAEQITAEMLDLEERRFALLNYRILLFGYGRSVLEPVVRSALRLLGFEVPEPETYTGEWDVELRDPHSGRTAIGEVEGTEGPIDVDKYRQLRDYIGDEELEGREHKGILIGNGYKSKDPNAPERQDQFTTHAQNGARRNGYCLLPTIELFKAVCAVLESPEKEEIKAEVRDSILRAVGVWIFSRVILPKSAK